MILMVSPNSLLIPFINYGSLWTETLLKEFMSFQSSTIFQIALRSTQIIKDTFSWIKKKKPAAILFEDIRSNPTKVSLALMLYPLAWEQSLTKH